MKVPARAYLVPIVEHFLPDEYKRWADCVICWHIDSLAISISWTIQRVISAYHSALIGGLLVSRNMLVYLSEMDVVHINADETYLDEFTGYGAYSTIACICICWRYLITELPRRIECGGIHLPDPLRVRPAIPPEHPAVPLHPHGVGPGAVYLQAVRPQRYVFGCVCRVVSCVLCDVIHYNM